LLRRWRDSGRAPFRSLNADPQVMQCMPRPLTGEESDRLVDRIEAHFNQHGFGLFAVETRDNGQFIGFVGLAIPNFAAPFTPCVEIGWRLARESWGMGFATEAAHEVLRYAFAALNLDRIVSFTVPANLRSQCVMQRLGMTRDPAAGFDHPSLPPGHPAASRALPPGPRKLDNPARKPRLRDSLSQGLEGEPGHIVQEMQRT
jgi:RimJ/RimL family protein N-acetyltransferase